MFKRKPKKKKSEEVIKQTPLDNAGFCYAAQIEAFPDRFCNASYLTNLLNQEMLVHKAFKKSV